MALRDRAGNLLAVSPHPLSIIPPLNVASPSPGIHTPPPAASQMQSLGGDAGAHAAPLSPFHSISPHAGNAGGRQGPGMHAGFTLASRLDARPLHDAGASAGWADTAGSQTLHPLSYGYKRDPRTEPTVGGGGGYSPLHTSRACMIHGSIASALWHKQPNADTIRPTLLTE